MAVGLNRHCDEIRIVERGSAALERSVVERPVRGPDLPDVARQRVPVLRKADAAALRMEIILIPEAMLLRRRTRLRRAGDVLDIVAVDGNEAIHALGPQR